MRIPDLINQNQIMDNGTYGMNMKYEFEMKMIRKFIRQKYLWLERFLEFINVDNNIYLLTIYLSIYEFMSDEPTIQLKLNYTKYKINLYYKTHSAFYRILKIC